MLIYVLTKSIIETNEVKVSLVAVCGHSLKQKDLVLSSIERGSLSSIYCGRISGPLFHPYRLYSAEQAKVWEAAALHPKWSGSEIHNTIVKAAKRKVNQQSVKYKRVRYVLFYGCLYV